ncbi:hypothetical protein AGMMS49579_01030 [Spirochaetia bacterium]|nr:hypothetical protein AGMMS49579_01030 [Spirochaetia bacterium]
MSMLKTVVAIAAFTLILVILRLRMKFQEEKDPKKIKTINSILSLNLILNIMSIVIDIILL